MNHVCRAWIQIFALVSPMDIMPVLFVSLLAAGAGIGLLSASAWLIASAALMPPLYTLSLGVTAVRAFGIGRAAFRYAERYLSHDVAFQGLTQIRLRLYDRAAARLPLRTGPMRQGEFLHDLLSGSDALRDFFVRALLPPLTVGILTGLITAVLFIEIGYAAALLSLLFFLRLCLSWRAKVQNDDARRKEESVYRSALLDAAAGADELICSGHAPILSQLKRPAENLTRKDEWAHKKESRSDAIQAVFDAAVIVLLLATLIPRVSAGALTGIGLAVWLLLIESLLAEYRTLPDAIRQAQKSAVAATHLLAPIESKPPQMQATQTAQRTNPLKKSADESSPALLTIEDLSFSYTPAQHLLESLSFSIREGEHTAIIGTSGAGKTTLAQILLGVWTPDKGSISRGRGISIAGLPQGSVLFLQSIRENFRRFRPEASEIEMLHALETAQLSSVIKAMEQGVDTPIGEDASFLSGGQRTRLLTALTIAGDERLILLDEPTLGLDVKTAARLSSALFAYAEENRKTLLVITHDMVLRDKFKQTIQLV